MKIGILTLPPHANYGGILQAYALQTILGRIGHNTQIFSRPFQLHPGKFALLKYAKRFIIRIFFRRPFPIYYEKAFTKYHSILEDNTKLFIQKYLNVYELESFESLSPSEFDAIVVGSDQVWRPPYFCGMYQTSIDNAFLKFTKGWNIKRVSYAASFGIDDWEYSKKQTEHCKHLIQHFDAVSVREEIGLDLCKKFLDYNNVQWVLDPTFLLEKDDYVKLIPNDIKTEGDLLCYVLDETPIITEMIKCVSDKFNMIPFSVNAKLVEIHKLEEQLPQPPLENWLAGFRDAKMVITDSFHACVFSILFRKPFVVIGNKNRGYSRFESLLKRFGLEDRLIEKASQINQSILKPLPDEVYKRLADYRRISNDFLISALK